MTWPVDWISTVETEDCEQLSEDSITEGNVESDKLASKDAHKKYVNTPPIKPDY